jgi:ornithine cyclodeaminase/alanine dehydrogenase-like protein (mu-crystallin family)
VLVLNGAQVEALVDLDALIDALASAMADLSSGSASAPDRVAALVPEQDGMLAAELSGALPAEVRMVPDFPEALAGATLACATTHATEPVIGHQIDL